MLNFAKACCLCVAMAFILAVSGAPADAFLSTNGVAADGSDSSLLLQIKKTKKNSGQSQNDAGLTECTIQQSGSGGGCKGGFKWVCEKMKSGNKCCGCVATGQGGGDNDNVLWRDYKYQKPQPEQGSQDPGTDAAKDWVDTQNKADGRFGVGYDAVPPAETAPQQ
jgi:hypothetical protein